MFNVVFVKNAVT